MLRIDNRKGSKDLAPKFKKRGAMVHLCTMPFGDIQFFGKGVQGKIVNIGVEVKGLQEFCSDLHNSRFTGHQVPGLLKDYDRVYLVINGFGKPDPKTGHLMTLRGKMWTSIAFGSHPVTYREFMGKVHTVQEKAGITVFRTNSDAELISMVLTLQDWWSKGYEAHNSLEMFYEVPKKGIVKPSRFRRAVHALCEGMGWKRTVAIEHRYPTMEALMDAELEELQEVPGMGKKLAIQLYNALR